MTTSRVRVCVLPFFTLAALAALAVSPAAAQTAPASQEKTPPLPPTIQQRFEIQEPPGDRPETRLAQMEFRFGRPVVRIGQDYTLKAGESIGAVRSAMADVRIEGLVTDDVVVVLGDVTLAGTAVIEGSLVVIGGSATIADGAVVRRDFVVVGGTATAPADFSPRGDHVIIGTPMLGESLRTLVPWLTRGLLLGRLIVPGLAWVWAIVGLSFLVGFAMNHVFDRQVSSAASSLARRPLSAFLTGLLVLLLTGPLLAIVAASIIGLAVVPFALAAVIVAALIGKIAVTRAIGRSIVPVGESEGRLQSWRSFTIGFIVIVVAYMIPVMGLLTWALVGVFGLGAATMSFAATLRRERPATPPKAPVELPPLAPPSGPSAEPEFRPASAPAYGHPPASAFVSAEAPAPTSEAPARGAAGDLSVYPRASFFDRVAAAALDVVLVAITNAVLRNPWGEDGRFLLVLLAYNIAFIAWKGTTLGGIICGVRVIRANGGDPRFVDALVRGLSSIFSVAALGIGCFWMLNDAERQMWHDKIAGTVVVKLPRELVLA
jgi:uncharacterized RDD family membrane protein YckC